MGSIASISGVALVPGVSSNRRLYTAEAIGKAAKRMRERLADPNGLPIVMRTHHDAEDDSSRIVGRVTEVTVDADKALRYRAELYDTRHGRDIASLVTPTSPALRSVSIHGYWIGDTRQENVGGVMAQTADDLEIDAIDFTAYPGVAGARIDPAVPRATESAGRTAISESMEASVAVEETSGWVETSEAATGELGEAKYSADDLKAMLAKGHAMKNPAGDPSYPIKDKADLAKAVKAVGRGNADHDAIRRHIIKRATALGAMDMIPDNWNTDGSTKETGVRLGEITEYFPGGPEMPSGFCIDAYSGPLSVTVRGCVSPDELRAAAQMAVSAAMDAISCMDPDCDADIDTGGADDGDGMSGDGMDGMTGESAKPVDAKPITEAALNELVAEHVRLALAAEKATAVEPVQEMVLPPDDHGHTHDMAEGMTHLHGHAHDHPEENGQPGYSHGHAHTHVHSTGDGPAHEHGHNHIHMTSSSATAENHIQEEPTMADTQIAAEAAPTRSLTAEDIAALGTVIGESVGGQLAEALRAIAEMSAPKHAATPTQETAEPVAPVEAAESVQKADIDVAALKESLAKELRKEIRDDIRAELLEERGLPKRQGYRLTENDEEKEMTNSELFDQHRTDILLGGLYKAQV